MSFDVPWRVMLDGRPVPHSILLNEFVALNIVPASVFADQRAWARLTLDPILNEHPESADAFWEVIYWLWRFQKTEEAGSEDPAWVENVKAWLVRTLDPG